MDFHRLTVVRVEEIFKDCLFRKDEIKKGIPVVDPLMVDGIKGKFGFHPDRIKFNEKDINQLLAELPTKFLDGCSFLEMCMDRQNNQWTGEHLKMEQLVCLGIAIGAISYCLPRDMWNVFPGGMPFIKLRLPIAPALPVPPVSAIPKKTRLGITKYVAPGVYIPTKMVSRPAKSKPKAKIAAKAKKKK